MSYIHEALKKAQKARTDDAQDSNEIPATPGERVLSLNGKLIWGISGGILIIFLAFVSYSWLDSKTSQSSTASDDRKKTPPIASQVEGVSEAERFYTKAKFFQKNGHLQSARRLYEQALSVNPDYVDALNNLGVIHIREQEYGAARINFEKAIRLTPTYVDSYYNLACLSALSGEVSEGLGYLRKAVALNPSAKKWAREDTDLRNLWKDPQFAEIIGAGGSLE